MCVEKNSFVVVLLSGGIDSTTCVEYYVSSGHSVSGLFVNYNQPQAAEEQIAANAVARHYKIKLDCVAIQGCRIAEDYIPGRNSLLLSIALMNFKHTHGVIGIGIHAGTSYADCSPVFKDYMQSLYDLYENGRIRIDAPFLAWKKSEILDYAKTRNIPLHLTHSNNLSDLEGFADY